MTPDNALERTPNRTIQSMRGTIRIELRRFESPASGPAAERPDVGRRMRPRGAELLSTA